MCTIPTSTLASIVVDRSDISQGQSAPHGTRSPGRIGLVSPRCLPDAPLWQQGHEAERAVWQALRDALPDEVVLLHSLAFVDGTRECETDLVVLWPGQGIAVIEVKGGQVACRDRQWTQSGRAMRNPLEQAGDARHALVRYLKRQTSDLGATRTATLVALPGTDVPPTWSAPDCARSMVLDRDQVRHGSATAVRHGLQEHGRGQSVLPAEVLDRMVDVLAVTLPGQTSLLSAADEHEQRVDLLTRDQARVLDGLRNFTRLKVVGGAGSGKTWLALEQARRLARDGQRVALMCYSRGLARWFGRVTGEWPARERPAYVGLFHDLPVLWGAERGADDDSSYWEETLPRALGLLAARRPPGDLFDAVIVDEGQDFGDLWWPSLQSCLRLGSEGRLYVFLDEAQRVFARQGDVPIDLPPFELDENIRNTKRIAQVFGSLGTSVQRFRGADGPPVVFRQCPSVEAVATADDQVDRLLDEGWDPGDIAVLTTHHRHPEHQNVLDLHGYDGYWDRYFDEEDIFYAHVLGFKGLERRAVVVAVDGFREATRAREVLYVALSRARSRLVVCGDLALISRVGGEGVRRRLARAG